MLQDIFQKLGSNANLIFSQKSVVNEASELSSDPKTEGNTIITNKKCDIIKLKCSDCLLCLSLYIQKAKI